MELEQYIADLDDGLAVGVVGNVVHDGLGSGGHARLEVLHRLEVEMGHRDERSWRPRRGTAHALLDGHRHHHVANHALEEVDVAVHKVVEIELRIRRVLIENADLDHDGILGRSWSVRSSMTMIPRV